MIHLRVICLEDIVIGALGTAPSLDLVLTHTSCWWSDVAASTIQSFSVHTLVPEATLWIQKLPFYISGISLTLLSKATWRPIIQTSTHRRRCQQRSSSGASQSGPPRHSTQEPGIEPATFWLPVNPLYLLSNCRPDTGQRRCLGLDWERWRGSEPSCWESNSWTAINTIQPLPQFTVLPFILCPGQPS